PQHSNCRLLSKRAVRELLKKTNEPFFLPCLAGKLPLRSTTVGFRLEKRIAGSSAYRLNKRVKLGLFALIVSSPFFRPVKPLMRRYSPKQWTICAEAGFSANTKPPTAHE
ncbi:MAG: hypothetical protein K6C36_10285, partial [Clostridia bacterium]|nr:hypothetical protein [Clostridia bacterium]